MTRAEAGQTFGVHRETVGEWVRAFRRGGEEALVAGRRGRRPGEQQALKPWMQAQLVKSIRGHNPDQLRLPFVLWTREAVRELVWQRFRVRLSVSTVGVYLRRWGFTPQKPVRRAFEQDNAAVASWLAREYPAIAARAKREGAMILWGDEMGRACAPIRPRAARGRREGRHRSCIAPGSGSAAT